MHAIIMAGGEGKRLRPLTCTMPKPMAPLLGRPIIDYCAALLQKHGFCEVTATLCYMPEKIKEHLGDGSAFGLHLGYAVETTPLGTAGSVRAALGDALERTLVISGDALTDFDLSSALRFHESQRAKVTILLSKVDTPTEYGVVLLGEDARVLRFFEKPQPGEVYSNLVNTGIYILEPEVLSRIPKGKKFDFSKDLFPLLLQEEETICGFPMRGYWCDIGSLSTYVQAQADLLDGKCEAAFPAAMENGVYVEKGAYLSRDILFTPPCYICEDAQIAPGARIGPYAVLGRGSKVGAYSSIKRSVLLREACLRENVELRGCVLGERAHLEENVSVFDEAAVGAEAWLERGVTVRPGVRIWPQRRVAQQSVCAEDVIWESAAAHESTKGYADLDMTPSYAASIGAAFAYILRAALPASFAVADDGSQQGVMLKSAVSAGLLSQGADVCDYGYISRDALSFAIRETDCAGGVYIEAGKTPHACSLLLHDSMGAEIDGDMARKLGQAMQEGLRPVTARRLGLLSTSDIQHSYDAHLSRCIGRDKLRGALVLAAPETVFDTVARVLSAREVRALFSRAEEADTLVADMMCSGAQIACLIQNGEICALYYGQRELDASARAAILMLSRLKKEEQKDFLVPVDMPEAYAQMLRQGGANVRRVSAQTSKWKREALRENLFDPALFEAEAAIVRLTQMALTGEMDRLLREIPQAAVREAKVACPWRDMGRVMRSLVETEKLSHSELLEGIRVQKDDGWVLVRPEGTHAYRVVADSMRAEYAGDLCELYVDKVKAAMESEE